MTKQFEPGNLHRRLSRIALNMSQLVLGECRVLARLAIERPPEDHPRETHESGDCECRPPTPVKCQPGDQKRRGNYADVRSSVEDAGCEGTLFAGKPFCDGLDRRGKVSRFSKAERETRQAEAERPG